MIINTTIGGGGTEFKIFTGDEPPANEPEGLFLPLDYYAKLRITDKILEAGDVDFDGNIENLPVTGLTLHSDHFEDNKFYRITVASGNFKIYIYDLITNIWTASSTIETTYSNRGVGIFNHKLIMVGGSQGAENTSVYDAEIYDLTTSMRSSITNVSPSVHNLSTMAKIGSVLYFYGGTRRYYQFSTYIEVYPKDMIEYDTTSQLWTTTNNSISSHGRSQKGKLVAYDGKILHINSTTQNDTGSSTSALNSVNFIFDVATRSFQVSTLSPSVSNVRPASSINKQELLYFLKSSSSTLTDPSIISLWRWNLSTGDLTEMLPASTDLTTPIRRFLGGGTTITSAGLFYSGNELYNLHTLRATSNNRDVSKFMLNGEFGAEDEVGITIALDPAKNVILSNSEGYFIKLGIEKVYRTSSNHFETLSGVKKRINGSAWTDL